MKISYSWLKEYINVELPIEDIDRLLTDGGLEVGGYEKVESIKGGLKGIVVGHVLTCDKHPNADKLSKTTVDVGTGEPLPIVCGAPNVAAGQKVLVATVGTFLYPDEEGFQIKKSKIRGEVSEGMICAEDELGLGQSHDGIMVLPEEIEAGTKASEYFNIEEDYVIEIDLTPNRADATSHIGVARDLAAVLNHLRKTNLSISIPNVNAFAVDNHDLDIEIEIQDEDACPRYTGVCMSGVQVQESPDWLKNRLTAIGLRPINNIVDISNYVLHETGHPLHIFDYDQIKGKKVLIRKMDEGTPFTTLDEVERKLSNEDLMICDAEDGMCMAGIFGGMHSGVTEKTTNIFIESAYFDASTIRRSSKRHTIKTDASFRFERGADPAITEYALKRAALLIKELANGQVASDVIDQYPKPQNPWEVILTQKKLNTIAGNDIPLSIAKPILVDLGVRLVEENDEMLKLEVPTFKVDVLREIDIIEEVMRVYGFNQIEIGESMRSSLSYQQRPDRNRLQNMISDLLVANGLSEAMNNSLSSSNYYIQSNDFNENKLVKIHNPLSSELDVMRMSLMFGLLESLRRNVNHKASQVKLFEFGKSYVYANPDKENVDQIYDETQCLSILYYGKDKRDNWLDATKEYDYFALKQIALRILHKLGYDEKNFKIENCEESLFAFGQNYKLNGKTILQLGMLKQDYNITFDVEKPIYYLELNWDLAMKYLPNKAAFNPIPKFPEVERDLSLLLSKDVPYSKVEEVARKAEKKLLKDVYIFDLYEGKGVPAGKKSYAVRFVLQDEMKTLNDKLIDKTMGRIQKSLEMQLQAELR